MAVDSEAVSWPIILHQSLAESELHQHLKAKQYRIRISSATQPHTCMFPLSSVVFAIEPLAEAVTEGPPSEKCQLDSQLLQRISKLATMCQKQYVLLVAAVLGTQELAILSALQKHFLNDGIQFIPVHNINECVQSMINIAKVACHPLKDIVTERFHRAIQGVLSENAVLSALHQMHLSPHDTTVLLDGCGSLQNIALSTPQDLMDRTSLDSTIATAVHKFFTAS